MRLTLTEARKKRKLTPEALAEKAGVHRATVYRLEADEITNPSIATVKKLEEALRVRRGTLVFGQVMEKAS